jgi:hypothetical protein
MTGPTIYDRDEAGLADNGSRLSGGLVVDTNNYGPLGDVDAVTIHHSAGPRAPSKAKAQALHKAYQRLHIQEFGTANHSRGDIGYHFAMDDLGRMYRLRPHANKGTHVGGWNTGNVGIMLHGNYVHDELTDAQNESLKWLFRGGFYALFGEPEAGIHIVRGHQEWPGHNTNACPGTNLMRHLAYLRNTEDY